MFQVTLIIQYLTWNVPAIIRGVSFRHSISTKLMCKFVKKISLFGVALLSNTGASVHLPCQNDLFGVAILLVIEFEKVKLPDFTFSIRLAHFP